MIEASEHFYSDDPQRGPRDVATRLRDVSYFFLGNGLIQAAVQFSPKGDGTLVGLLVMNPDRLRAKRAALTMDARAGLAATQLELRVDGGRHQPMAGAVRVAWQSGAAVPTVRVEWRAGAVRVEERFFCPDLATPRVCREIVLRNPTARPLTVEVRTGAKKRTLRQRVVLGPRAKAELRIDYQMNAAEDRVQVRWVPASPVAPEARRFWRSLARIGFGDALLDHFFQAARAQLPAAVSRRGCVDGSIWQYNLEWLRDQSVVALALTMLGATGPATTIVTRLLDKFVTPEGDTLDSSVKRNPKDVELDQNGYMLCTLRDYVYWTGNVDLVRAKWAKVVALAEFPLQPVFRHPESGLLVNSREFWERHDIHGIERGMELIYQVLVSEGLSAAASLARLTDHAVEAVRWDAEAARLKRAYLTHPRFRLHDRRGFIKRRAPDGRVQETISPGDCGLPPAVPLMAAGEHRLNPCASAALPIALGAVPPDSPVARRTIRSLEQLWNLAGNGGGYGRYHSSSEPDSPGGWPFASLFIARAAMEAGDDAKAWRVLRWLAGLPGASAGTWFEFYGERIAPPLPQVGLVVWNWAELVVFFVQHVIGLRPREDGVHLRPRLLSGVAGAQAEFTVRGRKVRVRIRRDERGPRFAARGAARVARDEVRWPYGVAADVVATLPTRA